MLIALLSKGSLQLPRTSGLGINLRGRSSPASVWAFPEVTGEALAKTWEGLHCGCYTAITIVPFSLHIQTRQGNSKRNIHEDSRLRTCVNLKLVSESDFTSELAGWYWANLKPGRRHSEGRSRWLWCFPFSQPCSPLLPYHPFLLCSFPLGMDYKSPSISRNLWPIYSQAHKPFPLTSARSQRQHPTQLRVQPEVPHSSPSPLVGQTQHHQLAPEKSLPTPTCLSEAFIPVSSHLSLMSCVEMCKPVPGMVAFANWQYQLDHK